MSHIDHEHKHQSFVAPMTNTPIQVPLHQTVQTGIELLRNPKYNKGLAFTWEERHILRLQGLLPPVVRDQEEQLLHVYDSLDKCHSALDKFIYIMGLLDRNEKLFYRALIEKITQLMPIVYTPTVGLVCQKYGSIFRVQRGLYVSLHDRGNVLSILNNWPERQVRAIVLTDGERILGLGDLGANGMGIPVGKLALYTACGGLDPSILLPITVDVGTDNETLLGDPFYMGLRQKRERGPAYDELIDEFVKAVKIRFGPYTLLQFEDFGNTNAFRFMEKYRNQACTFNDDIQGTAAVVVAGVVASCRLNEMKLSQHVYVFFGAGEAGIGAARLLSRLISEEESIPVEQARRNIWMVDSKGLVAKGRKAGGIEGHKAEFAREFPNPNLTDLTEIVQSLRATALFGLSGQPNVFTESVCRAMAANTAQPLIFPLSNPTSKSECTAEQAYSWTEGRCIFASGSPFPPYQHTDKLLEPGQANNCYIFPGMALAVVISGARRVTDDMFLIAAKSLASLVSSDDLSAGSVFPPLKNIREVSAHVAADICDEVYRLGLATVMPKPDDMLGYIKERMYTGHYPSYTSNTSNAYNQYE